MDLLKAWAVAVGVWLAGSLLTVVLFVNYGSLEQTQAFSGRLLAFYLPQLAVAVLMAVLAALVHPLPARERRGRHAAAALTVPAVAIVVGLLNSLIGHAPFESFVAALVTMTVGGVIGWQLADLVRPPRPQPAYTYGYPS